MSSRLGWSSRCSRFSWSSVFQVFFKFKYILDVNFKPLLRQCRYCLIICIGFQCIWVFELQKTVSCCSYNDSLTPHFISSNWLRDVLFNLVASHLILSPTQNAGSVAALWHLILDWYVEEMSRTAGPTLDCFFDPFSLRCVSNAARRSICSPNWWMWCPHGGLFAFSLCQLSFFLSSSSASSPLFRLHWSHPAISKTP